MNSVQIQLSDFDDIQISIYKDHIESIGCIVINNNKNELDNFWKNWKSLYEDYVYYLSLLQTKEILTFSNMNENICKYCYEIETNKYIGITFPLWFKLCFT